MAAISVRLPDEIETRLAHEAEIEGKPRSEVAREAIAEYLTRKEHERFMVEMITAAQALAIDPAAVAESLELANDLVDEALDATIEAEGTVNIHPHQKWWK